MVKKTESQNVERLLAGVVLSYRHCVGWELKKE